METEIQIAVAIQLAVFGAAHLLQPRALVQFYGVLSAKGEAGVVFIALLGVCAGSVIVAFHNVWTGIPIVLTVLGWAQVLKGTVYMLFPAFGLKQIARVTPERANLFRWPGIPLLIISALLAWHVLRPS